jgi:integrase
MRQPKPYFRKQTQTWYVQLGKVQHNLGRDEAKAYQRYYELLAGREPASATMTVVTVIDRFMADLKITAKAARTVEWYARYLTHAKTGFKTWVEKNYNGRLTVADVNSEKVNQWFAKCFKDSGDNDKNGAIRALSRAFNWAADEAKIIPNNPIAKMKRPAYAPREGEKAYLTASDWAKLMGIVPDGPFLDLIRFLRLTGARPDEACRAECRHFERDSQCLVFERVSSKGKRRQRVIQLAGEALEIIQRLTLKHGKGSIFQTTRGKRWTNSSLNSRCDFFREKAKLDTFFPYQLRHTYVTDALVGGVDVVALSKIVGHQDLAMINAVYSHLELTGRLGGAKGNYLREVVEKISSVA